LTVGFSPKNLTIAPKVVALLDSGGLQPSQTPVGTPMTVRKC